MECSQLVILGKVYFCMNFVNHGCNDVFTLVMGCVVTAMFRVHVGLESLSMCCWFVLPWLRVEEVKALAGELLYGDKNAVSDSCRLGAPPQLIKTLTVP